MKKIIIPILFLLTSLGLMIFFFFIIAQWPDGIAANKIGGIDTLDYFSFPAFILSTILLFIAANKLINFRLNQVGRIFNEFDPYGEENWEE